MVHEDTASDLLLVMGIVKGTIALLGATIAFLAVRAYRRSGDRGLALLAGGFGFVTLGAVCGGMVYELLGVSLATGVLVEALFVAVGFACVAASLRT